METAVLINRDAGALGKRGRVNRAGVVEALRHAGIKADPQWLSGPEVRKRAEAAVAAGAKLVIAGGGDGTLSRVAGVLAGTDTALGVLPLGTLNHFARDLSIPADLKAATALIATGKPRLVDVGEVGDRVFINNSAIGVYPLMVLDREAQRAHFGLGKRWAMAVAAVHTLLRFSSERLTLTADDRQAQVDTPLLFVGNNAYRMQLPNIGRRESLETGELFILVLRRKSPLGFSLAAARSLLGRIRKDDVVRLEHVRRMRVDSAKSHLVVAVDGETVRLKPPLDYRIRPRALKVIAPA